MKGCPLRCQWCQNPESWDPYPELMASNVKCKLFGNCVETCLVDAITLDREKGRKIDRDKCNLCFQCVDACPTGALKKAGEYMTVEEVMAEVERDEIFYRNSGGGVTISGGEPLFQWAFTYRLLKACKERYLHTALDTSGYARWPILEKVLKHVDLVLYDIKHMDPQLHKEGTGKDNKLILANLRRIPREVKIWLRVPLIPGYNDSVKNLIEVAKLGKEVEAERVSLLPFNKLGEGKYEQLDRRYIMAHTAEPTIQCLEEAKEIVEDIGIKVTIAE